MNVHIHKSRRCHPAIGGDTLGRRWHFIRWLDATVRYDSITDPKVRYFVTSLEWADDADSFKEDIHNRNGVMMCGNAN
jgi:hypothetical protein